MRVRTFVVAPPVDGVELLGDDDVPVVTWRRGKPDQPGTLLIDGTKFTVVDDVMVAWCTRVLSMYGFTLGPDG